MEENPINFSFLLRICLWGFWGRWKSAFFFIRCNSASFWQFSTVTNKQTKVLRKMKKKKKSFNLVYLVYGNDRKSNGCWVKTFSSVERKQKKKDEFSFLVEMLGTLGIGLILFYVDKVHDQCSLRHYLKTKKNFEHLC